MKQSGKNTADERITADAWNWKNRCQLLAQHFRWNHTWYHFQIENSKMKFISRNDHSDSIMQHMRCPCPAFLMISCLIWILSQNEFPGGKHTKQNVWFITIPSQRICPPPFMWYPASETKVIFGGYQNYSVPKINW